MPNMFRTLIHPSSGASDISLVFYSSTFDQNFEVCHPRVCVQTNKWLRNFDITGCTFKYYYVVHPHTQYRAIML